MRSLRYGNDWWRRVNADDYYANYDVYIDRLLHQPGTTVRLAVLAQAHDVVLGFSICRRNILDYVHVQADMRSQGIGSSLVPGDITTFTHLTKTGSTIWDHKKYDWTFNPFA